MQPGPLLQRLAVAYVDVFVNRLTKANDAATLEDLRARAVNLAEERCGVLYTALPDRTLHCGMIRHFAKTGEVV